MAIGTDVNFGELTRNMFNYLTHLDGVTMHFHHEVQKLKQREDKTWRIKVTDLLQARKRKVYTKIVYWCSGGRCLYWKSRCS
jgi:malate dehydrogenase (quinone)